MNYKKIIITKPAAYISQISSELYFCFSTSAATIRHNRGYRVLCVRNVNGLVEGDPYINMQYIFICICVCTLCTLSNMKTCFICYCWKAESATCVRGWSVKVMAGFSPCDICLSKFEMKWCSGSGSLYLHFCRFSLKCANVLLSHQLEWRTTTKIQKKIQSQQHE